MSDVKVKEDVLVCVRERFGRELRYQQLGCTSLVSLAVQLEQVVLVTRPEPTGDWKLYSRDLPPPVLQHPRQMRPPSSPSPPEVDPDDALPGVDFVSIKSTVSTVCRFRFNTSFILTHHSIIYISMVKMFI